MNSVDGALVTLLPPALRLIEQEGFQDSSSGPGPLVSTICLPDAITHDQNLSSLLPLYLHTASNQILEVGTVREQG